MLPWTNASLHQLPFYARRKPPARSAVVPLEEARSSSLGWEARAKAQRIVTSSSSVRVGAAAPPKSGCLRYWKECGRVPQLRCISLKKPHGPIPPISTERTSTTSFPSRESYPSSLCGSLITLSERPDAGSHQQVAIKRCALASVRGEALRQCSPVQQGRLRSSFASLGPGVPLR